MTSLLHQTIPVYQLLGLVAVYVLYKEFVKLLFKFTIKRIKARHHARLSRNQPGQVLGLAEDQHLERPEEGQVRGPLELDDQRSHSDTGHRPAVHS